MTASPGGDPQGVLRLVSDAELAGTVAIHAIDDAGARIGPITLKLNPRAAVEFTAAELQSGNTAKGLASGLGSLAGDVRLVIDSDVAIVPSAYVRSGDSALSTVHDTVIEARDAGTYRYDVAIFHPAANAAQQSRLRLINPGEATARVTIAARDDTGATATGGTVELTLPGGGAQTLTAHQLEAGDPAVLTGRLGAGVGNWRLSVMSDRPIQAVNVTVGSGGDWSNLSTTAVTGWAPEDEVSFQARFLERVIVSRDGLNRLEQRVLAEGRIRATVRLADGGEVIEEGGYGFERTGRDAGLLTLRYDSGRPCAVSISFDSPTSGWYASSCVDAADAVEDRGGGSWWALDAGAAPLDLGSGLDDMTYAVGTAIDVLTLSAATAGGGGLTYSLSPEVPGLTFDAAARELTGTPSEVGTWLMTYRVRDASGDSDWRYFNIAVEVATGGMETTHGVGDTLSDLPTGSWTPDVTSGGSFSSSAGNITVNLNEGGYIEEGGHRYTCQSTGGCVVENRRVTSGTVVQTASGTAPGGGASGDPGDDRASAAEVAAESDTEGDLTAGDVDYFRVAIDAPGTLEAYTTGRTDTLGRLEDADGSELSRNDDGGAGTNFRISEDVTPGTYYVRVAGYSSRTAGDYTLHVRFTESDLGTTPPNGGGMETTHGVGDTLSDLPTGFWNPDVTSGGSFSFSDGNGTVRLNDGGYIEEGGFRYTCQSSGGCVIENRSVTSGTVVQTASGTAPGEGTDDRAALMALYNATDGPNWTTNENWGSDAPLDQWHGVVTDDNGRVYWINLDRNQLSGPIPTEMGRLSNLIYLGLFDNQLSGPIPAELGSLSNLASLYLNDNQLSGPIPAELGSLSNLTTLDLNGNQLSGPIPAELDNLLNLVWLDLHENQLSGPIPAELGNLANLARLYLHENQLSGPIPTELGDLSNLEDLFLYSNQLSGSIPAELGNLSNLVQLALSINQLSGQIPAELGNLSNLEWLGLYTNRLSGPIPTELGDLSNLLTLYLGGNQLSGCIPNVLRDVATNDLSTLGLAYCEDSGTPGGGQETTHGVGDTLTDLPTGSWTPDVTSGASFSFSGGNATVRLNEGGYIEEGSFRYTCQSSGGCVIENRRVTSGTVVQTASGTAPGSGGPDLVVQSASVSDASPSAGGSFTLSATVRNDGDGDAPATTLRYYRSSNATISRSDTQVGTDSVSGLSASRTSAESISLTAPSSAGTYYYGACVDSVTGESDTDNNCSSGVRVTVSSGETGGGGNGNCVEVNDVIELGEGESCTITQALVNKYSLNSVSVRVGDTASCSGGRVTLGFFSGASIQLNGLTIRCQ